MTLFNSPFNPVATPSLTQEEKAISSIDAKLSRTNYFDGRLLKASDLIRDQLYLDERLREAGRVLGQGILRGLQLTLAEDGELTVAPGLAVTPSGRVLELETTTIRIDLLDSAAIAAKNEGHRAFSRGLYAVVLQYAEEDQGSAEVYPFSPDKKDEFHVNAVAEGVEVVLTPLKHSLPYLRQHKYDRLNNSVLSRAALVRELIMANRQQPADVSDDGVALGLIAIENNAPVWLDLGLIRRMHRSPLALNRLQLDLFYHYEELLSDVLTLRQQSLRGNAFLAHHYFDVLPPFGSIPKDSVDPINGYQKYFPDAFEVAISPIRQDDLEAVVQQSLPLQPIDFAKDRDVDIMILVPMSDAAFAHRARQLQHRTVSGSSEDFVLPAHLDDYQLKAYGQRTVHEENTDAAVWQDIWAEVDAIYYVRRPTRVAETQVSAIVLATGDYDAEAYTSELPPDLADLTEQIETLEAEVSDLEVANQALQEALEDATNNSDEVDALNAQIAQLQQQRSQLQASNTALQQTIKQLNEQLAQQGSGVSFETLVALRVSEDERALEAKEKLKELIAEQSAVLNTVSQLFLLMPPQYDALNWPTLAELAAAEELEKLHEALLSAEGQGFVALMQQMADDLPMSEKTAEGWKSLKVLASAASSSGSATSVLSVAELERVPVVKVADLLRNANVTVPARDTELIEKAAEDDPELLKRVNQLSAIVGEQYRDALWVSLPTLIENGTVDAFQAYLLKAAAKGLPLGVSVGASISEFKLSTTTRRLWADADLQG